MKEREGKKKGHQRFENFSGGEKEKKEILAPDHPG